jgi:hypothetical protein
MQREKDTHETKSQHRNPALSSGTISLIKDRERASAPLENVNRLLSNSSELAC